MPAPPPPSPEFADQLRERMERLRATATEFGVEWYLDEAFGVFGAGYDTTTSRDQWACFGEVLGELDVFWPPGFETVFLHFGPPGHKDPWADWDTIGAALGEGSFPAEVVDLFEQATAFTADAQFDPQTPLRELVLEVEDGGQHEVKLATHASIRTFADPIALLDAVLADA